MFSRYSSFLTVLAAAIALVVMAREAGLSGSSVQALTAFTTVTNLSSTSGPMKPNDFMPFFNTTAVNDPLVKAKTVTVENSSISSLSWVMINVLNPGSPHIIDCVKGSPSPRSSSMPFIPVMGLTVKTSPIFGQAINGVQTNGFHSEVNTQIDQTHSQVVLVDSYFAPSLEDPDVSCFGVHPISNVGDGSDIALEAVVGEITLLQEAQSVQQSNVKVTGVLPLGQFLMYAKVTVYDLNVPAIGTPAKIYTIENGNVAPPPAPPAPPPGSNNNNKSSSSSGGSSSSSNSTKPPAGDPNATFTGNFAGSLQATGLPGCLPGGGMSTMTLAITQSGNSVTGTFSAEFPNTSADSGSVTGTVSGGVLSLTMTGTHCTYTGTATISGNTITGEYHGTGGGVCSQTNGTFKMSK
jgi:hypothetical protein